MGGAHYLNVRVKVVVLSLGGDRGYRVPAGLLLWCRTIGLVLRARILLFAALFLPLLGHGVNASGQFFAIATNGSAVPMLVGNPTAFLRQRSLRWKVRYAARGAMAVHSATYAANDVRRELWVLHECLGKVQQIYAAVTVIGLGGYLKRQFNLKHISW